MSCLLILFLFVYYQTAVRQGFSLLNIEHVFQAESKQNSAEGKLGPLKSVPNLGADVTPSSKSSEEAADKVT